MSQFDSIEQRRAWQLAIEWSYRTLNKISTTANGMQTIAKLAEEGDLIAIGIMFQYTKARMQQ